MQVCNQCSRVNPPEAAYCYHDGALLAGHRAGGPINPGTAPFPTHFVFPTGEMCRNFDQLALACQLHWKAAVDLLKQGFLGTFLGGLGRADLALAAQEAARFPDEDRGLDQLLAKLPTNVLEAPKVQAEPSDINLGQIAMRTDRATELHLSNLGMRLLYGSVVSDSKWLTLGEAPGNPQKLFQFGADTLIPVHIRGKDLKAGTKPLIGHLTIESNGGTAVVTVKADVPITPFTDGALAGALTPRQVAEKAKANPKDAAPLFEKGAVGQWYTQNGWTYPVQGPNASGLGAVQQFFEALGLAKAPKVEVKTKSITLQGDAGQCAHKPWSSSVSPSPVTLEGDAGQNAQAVIEVTSPELKPVYAHAVCDQAWVECSKVKLSRNNATITVAVPVIPNRPGETLRATITVIGNGNQRFKVPLTLTVGAGNPFAELVPVSAVPPVPGAAPLTPLVLSPAEEAPVVLQGVNAPAASVVLAMPNQAFTALPPPLLPTMTNPAAAATPAREAIVLARRKPAWVHLAPLGVLAFVLLGLLLRDLVANPDDDAPRNIDDLVPRASVFFDWKADIKDHTKEKDDLSDSLSWGLVARGPTPKDSKRLTYYPRGQSNLTMVLIDGQKRLFGNYAHGKWEETPRRVGKWGGKTAAWLFHEQMVLTQHVEMVPGEPVEVGPEDYKRLIDTCLVRYKLHNKHAQKTSKVGLGFLLDTYIGMNDGVPFLLPGDKNLVSTQRDFANPRDIPDFIQAYENNDINEPGTIAQLNLRLGKRFDPPGRVSLTQHPGRDFFKNPLWEVPLKDIETDSAVVIYWSPEELGPGKTREMAFTYGLGTVSVTGGKLGLTAQGNLTVGGELTIVALVADPQPGQKVTLDLHQSLQLLPGFELVQDVPAPQQSAEGKVRPSPVTWRVRSTEASARNRGFPITITTSDGLTQTRVIRIKSGSIF